MASHLRSALLLLLGLGGCAAEAPTSADVPRVFKEARSDSVTLTVTAKPAETEVSQRVHVELEVVSDPSVTVSLENYGYKLTESERAFQYQVVRSDERTDPPTRDGKTRRIYTYELEFFLADAYELPSAKLTYEPAHRAPGAAGRLADADEEPEPRTLETDPLPVLVKESAKSSLTPEELRKITVLDPIELPDLWRRWWWVLTPAAVLAAAAIVVLLRRRRKRLSEIVIPIPAHEWAYAELARLIADDLVAKNCMQEFFYRISDVVRGYLERRFGVSAPEMTTEEFLAAAVKDLRFDLGHTEELMRFLHECDLVKYARHEPTTAECDGVLKAARRFIERTREHLFESARGLAPAESAVGTEERAA